jgi:hypothetical protein
MDENLEKIKTIYLETSTLMRQQETLLFQRFNYFLISSAFFISAFVVLAVNSVNQDNPIIIGLTVFIGIAGFCMSWLFSSINCHNAKLLKIAYDILVDNESYIKNGTYQTAQLPYKTIRDKIWDGKFKFGISELILYPGEGLRFGYVQKNYDIPAPHTYTIPTLFSLFWLIVISIYSFTISMWLPITFIFLFLTFISIYCIKIYKKLFPLFTYAKKHPNIFKKKSSEGSFFQ